MIEEDRPGYAACNKKHVALHLRKHPPALWLGTCLPRLAAKPAHQLSGLCDQMPQPAHRAMQVEDAQRKAADDRQRREKERCGCLCSAAVTHQALPSHVFLATSVAALQDQRSYRGSACSTTQ